MSQDLCEFFFETVDASITCEKAQQEVETLLRSQNLEISEVYSGTQPKDKRTKVIQIASNDLGDAIEDVLKLIRGFPCVHEPYARLFLDQAGETLFFALVQGKLANFASLEALEDYFGPDRGSSPEERFFSRVEESPNLLLIRLRVTGKRAKERIETLCSAYVSEPTVEAFDQLKSYLDKSAEGEVDFPHLASTKADHRGSLELAKSLSFCEVDGDYIYLGFVSDRASDSAVAVIYAGHYSEALNMVIAFSWCKGVKDARAKLWSTAKNRELEWYMYNVPGADFMCFEGEKSPITLWQG